MTLSFPWDMKSGKLIKNLPNAPGVYFFKDKKGKIIYVGKANDLRARARQYFTRDKNQHPKIKALVSETTEIEWQICESGIDALIQEARLIKKHRPKYNILLRDDKNYFFVGISKEEYPCIFITHQPLKATSYKLQANHIGPFTDGNALKQTLKILRRIFPYRYCRKMPKRAATRERRERSSRRMAANARELTRDFAPYAIPKTKAEVRRNIRAVVNTLSGKKQSILERLQRQMLKAARAERFDLAEKYKNQAEYMRNVFAHRRFLEELPIGGQLSRDWSEIQKQLLLHLDVKRPSRVEGYDISNIGGQYAVGSMVVFVDGAPDKSQYRKFKINPVRSRARAFNTSPVREPEQNSNTNTDSKLGISTLSNGTSPKDRGAATSNGIKYSGEMSDDPKMMAEILARRIKHKEWPRPDLIIVDGGITQLNAARAVLPKNQLVISLAKKEEEIYAPNHPPIHAAQLGNETKLFLQHLRDEAHRFAITYHKKLRWKALRK